eukprot:Phypoly_transcript_14011.p1 GENE.Phypoly_transcript_14011~~Phypoly_transcript_14011.p1  ORF type:complete len:248 (+),score=43.30 Phypoly_transcript_14011:28-744(+)
MDEDEEEKDDEPITPYQEIETTLQRVPDVPSFEVAVEKTMLLVEVLRKYLTPCLMATPLVYLSDDSWEFYDHKAFRAARRKELVDISESLKTISQSSDEASSSVVNTIKVAFGRQSTDNMPNLLPSIVEGLENVFLEVLKVRLPAMPSIYLTENFFDTIPVKEAYQELITKLQKNRKMDIRTRVYGLGQIFVQFLLLCPIGRPQLYVNDTEWKLVSEKDLRADLRRMIFQRNANVASP